jgi:alpha-L-fucosidase
MAQVNYSSASPYFKTGTFGIFLDVMTNRSISKLPDDVLYEIDSVYEYRPDLLAADLYGSSALWWVFAQRNPNVLVDPLMDFVAGARIYIPKLSTLKQDLGV